MERRSPIKDSIGSLSSSCGSSSGGVGGKTQPFMIGVAGGTASGKTTVCEKIMEAVNSRADLPPSSGSSSSDEGAGGPNQISDRGEKRIVAISEDSFYRELDEKESLQAGRGMFNFDHPDAFDTDTMMRCLADIREGKVTKVPEYDFKTNARMRDSQGQEMFRLVYPSDVVLLEGILVFYHKEVRDMFDMKLFVDTDADTRLSRRVLRDIEHRGRDLEHVLHQYTTLVKPAFEEFCLPTKKFADVIIPRGADNTVAISLIGEHIRGMLRGKGLTKRRTSTFVDPETNPQPLVQQPQASLGSGSRPHLPHRTMMTPSISLPAGSSNFRVGHDRTPPRFLVSQNYNRNELDPFQQDMARNYLKDPNYQLRPH